MKAKHRHSKCQTLPALKAYAEWSSGLNLIASFSICVNKHPEIQTLPALKAHAEWSYEVIGLQALLSA